MQWRLRLTSCISSSYGDCAYGLAPKAHPGRKVKSICNTPAFADRSEGGGAGVGGGSVGWVAGGRSGVGRWGGSPGWVAGVGRRGGSRRWVVEEGRRGGSMGGGAGWGGTFAVIYNTLATSACNWAIIYYTSATRACQSVVNNSSDAPPGDQSVVNNSTARFLCCYLLHFGYHGMQLCCYLLHFRRRGMQLCCYLLHIRHRSMHKCSK